MMTVFQAARMIQKEQGVRWDVALTWAHDCRKTAMTEPEAEARRRAFFLERRAVLDGERFRARLRAQPLMEGARLKSRRAVDRDGSALGGGEGVEFYECDRRVA